MDISLKPLFWQRVVYKVNSTSRSREIIGEFQYANANLSLCTGPGVRYPEPEARMRHMHSSKINSLLSLLRFSLSLLGSADD